MDIIVVVVGEFVERMHDMCRFGGLRLGFRAYSIGTSRSSLLFLLFVRGLAIVVLLVPLFLPTFILSVAELLAIATSALGPLRRASLFPRTSSESGVCIVAVGAAVLLHELRCDIGGSEGFVIGSGLKQNYNKSLPGGLPWKRHEHDLSEELVVEALGSEFAIFHGEEVQVFVHVVPVIVFLL